MHRCDVSNVCGCHGVATWLARYALIASLERKPNERENERTNERTNERPALSKDKGGNSPRQIIEWPDSASLFLSSSFPLSFSFYPASSGSFILPHCALDSTGIHRIFLYFIGKRKSIHPSMDDAIRQFRRCNLFSLLSKLKTCSNFIIFCYIL